MPLTKLVQNARPLSLFVGFFTGIVSMVYLFLHNEQMGDRFLEYITFALAIFVFSNLIAIGSFVTVECLFKKPKKSL